MTAGLEPAPRAAPEVVVCVDVGSTFTKAAAIDGDGRLIAYAEVPTTSDGDVPRRRSVRYTFWKTIVADKQRRVRRLGHADRNTRRRSR